MNPLIRRCATDDVPRLADICFRAFKSIADAHNYAVDFPDVGAATGLIGMLTAHKGFYGVVAEFEGSIVGSNFLDERNSISGIGPITIDPDRQNGKVGFALMQAVLERAAQQGAPGVRLVQATYHRRSLALYMKLGFEVRELLVCLQGPAIHRVPPGYSVRPASAADAFACNQLCTAVHGHTRAGELADGVAAGTATVVERAGRITGYATSIAFFGHAVGETDDDMKALIGAAESFGGPGFLAPAANGALVRWCMESGLRITQAMTLMSRGLFQEPKGAWLPSVTY